MRVDLHVHAIYSGATTIYPLSRLMKESYQGMELTAVCPRDGVHVHLGVLGIDESQHREIQWLRHNVRELWDSLDPPGA